MTLPHQTSLAALGEKISNMPYNFEEKILIATCTVCCLCINV